MSLRPQTALQCLTNVAKSHGVELSVDRLHHAYAVGEDPISRALLLRIAKEAGLRARIAQAATRPGWPARETAASWRW